MSPRPALYVDTVRRMEPRQLVFRARRVVPPKLLAPRPARRAPAWNDAAHGLGVPAAPQSGPTPPPAETGSFEAVGYARPVDAPGFWEDRSDGLLFLFHLHELVPLAEYAAGPRTPSGDAFWQRVVESWIERHSVPGGPGWHPYPTSGRIIALLSATAGLSRWPSEFRERVAAAAWNQARYLARCVEHDVGGNHVIRNATALAVAGAVFADVSLQRRSVRLLRAELVRQFLADGGHVERSPSYQRQVTGDVRDALTALGRVNTPADAALAEAVARSQRFLRAVAAPDGKLPLLNDSWDGPPTDPATDELAELAATGYTVLRSGDDYVLFDHAPLSAPHLPPHAHADALSFVLAVDGKPVVVDRGSFAYTGPARDEFRSTAAHSTVEVAGRDQCEFWGDFRLAFPPRVRARHARCGPVTAVCAWHDGYRRLSERVTHARYLVWWPRHGVVIVDRLIGRETEAVSRLHLAPHADASILIEPLGDGRSVREAQARHSPYLGTAVSAPVLERSVGRLSGWSILREGSGVVSLDERKLVLRAAEDAPLSVQLDWPDP